MQEEQLLKELADQTIATYKLEILDGGSLEDKVRWTDETEGLCTYSIPKGLTARQALYFVYLWNYGREVGERNGREKLQQDFRELLGAAREE